MGRLTSVLNRLNNRLVLYVMLIILSIVIPLYYGYKLLDLPKVVMFMLIGITVFEVLNKRFNIVKLIFSHVLLIASIGLMGLNFFATTIDTSTELTYNSLTNLVMLTIGLSLIIYCLMIFLFNAFTTGKIWITNTTIAVATATTSALIGFLNVPWLIFFVPVLVNIIIVYLFKLPKLRSNKISYLSDEKISKIVDSIDKSQFTVKSIDINTQSYLILTATKKLIVLSGTNLHGVKTNKQKLTINDSSGDEILSLLALNSSKLIPKKVQCIYVYLTEDKELKEPVIIQLKNKQGPPEAAVMIASTSKINDNLRRSLSQVDMKPLTDKQISSIKNHIKNSDS